ncbi:MAG: dTDP-4-dehydrorhamnose reductase [Congregibacter sp.]
MANAALRTLITGAGGQLGLALQVTAPNSVQVHALSRGDCDISDKTALESVFERLQPQVVINAAAYTAVDAAEGDIDAAFKANAEAPAMLAALCAQRGIRLLHVSTDFVFDGERSTPYPVDAPTAPLGVYGESKLAGEKAVLQASERFLVMRTGWVYSHRGKNFFQTMLRLHRERDQLAVVADQVGTPTRAESLARALWSSVERPELCGVYHLSDAGVCSWYDFAVAIGEEAQAAGLITQMAAVTPISSAEYPTDARRPAYSVLDKTASWRDLELSPLHWREALRDTIKSAGDALSDAGNDANGAVCNDGND